jgi:hypothetical protein
VRKTLAVLILLLACCLSLGPAAQASEPEEPATTSTVPESKTEDQLAALGSLPFTDVIGRLTSPELVVNKELLNRAIIAAFGQRPKEAIAQCLNIVKTAVPGVTEEGGPDRGLEFYVVTQILHVFADQACNDLVTLYQQGNAVMKANVIRVLGTMAGGPIIEEILIQALDQKIPCDEADTDLDKMPLRLCDIAYNQLVLRTQVQGVVRTLSEAHSIQTRDYQINALKTLLRNHEE